MRGWFKKWFLSVLQFKEVILLFHLMQLGFSAAVKNLPASDSFCFTHREHPQCSNTCGWFKKGVCCLVAFQESSREWFIIKYINNTIKLSPHTSAMHIWLPMNASSSLPADRLYITCLVLLVNCLKLTSMEPTPVSRLFMGTCNLKKETTFTLKRKVPKMRDCLFL